MITILFQLLLLLLQHLMLLGSLTLCAEKWHILHCCRICQADQACIAIWTAGGAHPARVRPDLGLGPHHQALRVEQVIAVCHTC